MSAAALVCRQVTVTYGRGDHAVNAVTLVDLTVRAGEVVGVRGDSGSGKSTLLRLCAGIERPSAGTVERVGRAMPVFQDPVGSLDPRWPLWRTVTEPLMARDSRRGRVRRSDRRIITAEQLASVGLDDVDAVPGELSRGQRQRVAILRALVAEPAVVLADEPTSALDVSVAAGVLHLLADIARRGTALLVASHDEAVLAVLCDRVMRMHDGELRES